MYFASLTTAIGPGSPVSILLSNALICSCFVKVSNSPEAACAMSQFANGLQFAAGNDITHVGTEEGTVVVGAFKVR